jgi:hypothetical protein
MNWKVGDRCICVNARKWFPKNIIPTGLKAGAFYEVEEVVQPQLWATGDVAIGLVVSGVRSANPRGDIHHARFRKLEPHTPDRFDEEVIAELTYAPVHPLTVEE